jgi:hypothetical protein
MLTQVSAGTWGSPARGISLDPYETVAAVLSCATRVTSLRNGLVSAVQLGGDTDTVAALVGGLMGSKLTAEQVRAELPWHQSVVLPEPESALAETADTLAYPRDPVSMRPGAPSGPSPRPTGCVGARGYSHVRPWLEAELHLVRIHIGGKG